jgi:hypothetical protein
VNLDLTDEETVALLRELDGLIGGDCFFLTLKAIRAKIRLEPLREPLPPPSEAICATTGDSEAETARRALICENHAISYEQAGFSLPLRQREEPAQNGGGPTISQPCRRRISLASASLIEPSGRPRRSSKNPPALAGV